METLSGAVGIIVAALAIIAALGVAFVYFRGSADRAVLESQDRLIKSRDLEISDLTRRVSVLEEENKHLREAVAQVAGIDHLQVTADAIKADTTAILSRAGAA